MKEQTKCLSIFCPKPFKPLRPFHLYVAFDPMAKAQRASLILKGPPEARLNMTWHQVCIT